MISVDLFGQELSSPSSESGTLTQLSGQLSAQTEVALRNTLSVKVRFTTVPDHANNQGLKHVTGPQIPGLVNGNTINVILASLEIENDLGSEAIFTFRLKLSLAGAEITPVDGAGTDSSDLESRPGDIHVLVYRIDFIKDPEIRPSNGENQKCIVDIQASGTISSTDLDRTARDGTSSSPFLSNWVAGFNLDEHLITKRQRQRLMLPESKDTSEADYASSGIVLSFSLLSEVETPWHPLDLSTLPDKSSVSVRSAGSSVSLHRNCITVGKAFGVAVKVTNNSQTIRRMTLSSLSKEHEEVASPSGLLSFDDSIRVGYVGHFFVMAHTDSPFQTIGSSDYPIGRTQTNGSPSW